MTESQVRVCGAAATGAAGDADNGQNLILPGRRTHKHPPPGRGRGKLLSHLSEPGEPGEQRELTPT